MQQQNDTNPGTIKQPRKELTRFDVANCDVRTQLMFEPWATIPALKVLTLLLARKGKHIFSAQKIGEMLDLPKSTVIHALKLLRDNEYIVLEGRNYYLNLGLKSDQSVSQADQPVSQSTNPLVGPTNSLVAIDQSIGRETTNPLVANNNKEIIIKNEEKENEGLTLSAGFNSGVCREAVQRLQAKLRQHGRSLDQIQLDAHCINFGTPENLIAAINYTCGLTVARNLYPPPDRASPKSPAANGRPPPKEYKHPWEQRGHVPANQPVGSLTKALTEKLDMKRTGTK